MRNWREGMPVVAKRAKATETSNPSSDEAEHLPVAQYPNLTPWKPGHSGNPGGIGGAYLEARKICADASPRAARLQVELMDDPDKRIALLATQAVLERGVGKPRDHSGEDKQQRVDLTALSSDERASLAALLRKALGV